MLREEETIAPLAAQLGLEILLSGLNETATLAELLITSGLSELVRGCTDSLSIVCWEHYNFRKLGQKFGKKENYVESVRLYLFFA